MKKTLLVLIVSLFLSGCQAFDLDTTVNGVNIRGNLNAMEIWNNDDIYNVLGSASCVFTYQGATAYKYLYQNISTTENIYFDNDSTQIIIDIITTLNVERYPILIEPYAVETIVNPSFNINSPVFSFQYKDHEFDSQGMYINFEGKFINDSLSVLFNFIKWVEYKPNNKWVRVD